MFGSSVRLDRALFLATTLVGLVGLAGCAAAPTTADEEAAESTDSSIVGGQTTSAFPAVGALTEFGSPFCTGTVVAPRVVVTAAHCLEGMRASAIRFAIGPNASAPSASIPVAKATIHPSYDPNRIANDIGVLVLAADAPVTPIAINDEAMTASWVGRSLTFVGYGVTDGFTQRGMGVKREVDIPIAQVGASQFAYTGSKNTCFGDSGGPALGKDEDGNPVLVGVTSWGDELCRQFGVDTRVDVYRSFIAQASK